MSLKIVAIFRNHRPNLSGQLQLSYLYTDTNKHKTSPSHHTKCTQTLLHSLQGPPLWSPHRPDTKPSTWSPNLSPHLCYGVVRHRRPAVPAPSRSETGTVTVIAPNKFRMTNPSYWLRCENLICGPRFESGTRRVIVVGPRRRPRCNDDFTTAGK